MAKRDAEAPTVIAGDYGVCPWCDMPVAELVRLGEILYCDPCGHPLVRLRYLRGHYKGHVKAAYTNQQLYPPAEFDLRDDKPGHPLYGMHRVPAKIAPAEKE